MIIKDDWKFDDLVTGLKFKIVVGEKLNRLEIENIKGGDYDNRSFWFTKSGDFDGTGSRRCCPKSEIPDDIDPEYEAMRADLTPESPK